jgi:hypothetical protein
VKDRTLCRGPSGSTEEDKDIILSIKSYLPIIRLQARAIDFQNGLSRDSASSQQSRYRVVGAELNSIEVAPDVYPDEARRRDCMLPNLNLQLGRQLQEHYELSQCFVLRGGTGDFLRQNVWKQVKIAPQLQVISIYLQELRDCLRSYLSW